MPHSRPASLRPVLGLLLALCLSPMAQASGGGGGGGEDSGPGLAGNRNYQNAQKLIRQKDWAGAEKELRLAAGRFEGEADVYNWLGYVQRKQGKLDAAFADYGKALQLNPKHRGALEYRGEAWLMANKPEEAEKDLATLANLCSKCEEREDLEKAIAAYKAGGAKAASAGGW